MSSLFSVSSADSSASSEVEGHDWEYLLAQMNLLHMDRPIGLAAHRAGLVMMAGAILWACWAVPRGSQREE